MTDYERTIHKRRIKLLAYADRTQRTWPYRSARAFDLYDKLHEKLERKVIDKARDSG